MKAIELPPVNEKKTWNTPELIQIEKQLVQAGAAGTTEYGLFS